VAARRAKGGEETVQLVKEVGSEDMFVKTDVTKEDDVRSVVEETVKVYSRLNYGFKNAGIEEMMTPFVARHLIPLIRS
jgi:NAD(P)-dependent dehydrogenase (short-subunit alcohol dehydrogenase family)